MLTTELKRIGKFVSGTQGNDSNGIELSITLHYWKIVNTVVS